jgi:hypothetical protein
MNKTRKGHFWFGIKIFAGLAAIALFCLPVTGAHAQQAGLWTGEISVDKVSEVRNSPDTPTATASEFNMNILVHQDQSGQARLVKDVTVMRKTLDDGNYKIVLLTDDTLIPNYEGVIKRNGEMIGVRLGSVFYDFDGKTKNLTGQVKKGGTLSAAIECAAGFSSNPYRHKYHPDHREGVSFTRNITLEIRENPADTDASGNPKRSGYGVEWLEGVFRETVSGLHKIDIHAEGTFTLQKISQVGALNE